MISATTTILKAILAPEMLRVYAVTLRPLPETTPARFAETYRNLKEGTTERPGPWSNDVFPYLVGVMDAVKEALDTGKRGLVLMKSGQGGGSEAMINALCWLTAYYPGPALYLISKDEIAREFGRERFGYITQSCAPLRAKCLSGRGAGELTHIKRFADGKWVIQGGRSVLNLQSQPYRFVFIDEVDSLLDEIEGHGDPIRLAEIRTDAFQGQTLIVAFAHPSIRERGAGRLYYELSDQRRGFVVCPHCGGEFWLSWDHVKAVPDVGMNRQQAERDPRLYRYFAPCCGTEISDAQRYAMARRVTQRTTLPAAEAARRSWIGVHFSQLYMPNKPLELLAKRWIDGAESEPIRRVFVNKCLGDVFDHSLRETSPDILRRLVVLSRGEDDPAYYGRGQVPKGVRFLTAGFDYRTTEFHFCVWGWGLVRDDTDYAALCGWLVDWGVYRRPYSATIDAAELRVFDGIYDQAYPGTAESARYFVEQGFHDAGWQPIPVYEYCRRRPFRAFPSKGSGDGDAVPETTAAFLRWSGPPVWRIGEEEVRDERLRLCILNTFTLKEDWYGLAEKTFRVPAAGGSADIRTRFTLPRDVDDEWLAQSAAEHITTEKRKRVWKRRGPNHFGDCNIYAYAAARNLDPFQQGLPMDETKQETPRRRIDSPRVIRRAY